LLLLQLLTKHIMPKVVSIVHGNALTTLQLLPFWHMVSSCQSGVATPADAHRCVVHDVCRIRAIDGPFQAWLQLLCLRQPALPTRLFAGWYYGPLPWLHDQFEAWPALAVCVHADELHSMLIGVGTILLGVDVLLENLQIIISFYCY
jgi:hypothetical protein